MEDRNWQEVKRSGDDFFPTWDFDTEADGPIVEGKYLSKKTNIGPNNSTKYVLELTNGDKIEVWGSTVLDNKMNDVREGQYVRIQYLGKTKGKRGSYHDWAVMFSD